VTLRIEKYLCFFLPVEGLAMGCQWVNCEFKLRIRGMFIVLAQFITKYTEPTDLFQGVEFRTGSHGEYSRICLIKICSCAHKIDTLCRHREYARISRHVPPTWWDVRTQ
jgi:hypothetical protein